MTVSHVHKIVARLMLRILDYDTLTIGCESCGTQWVVTLNWFDNTFLISWVNMDLSIYYDSRRGFIQIGDAIFSPWGPTPDAAK